VGSDTNCRCSRCGSPVMHLSRTRFWEWPLRLIQIRAYRCRKCGFRFYASISYGQVKVQDQVASPAEREFPFKVTNGSAGGLRVGSGKWMLLYGLLTSCLIIGAIVSLKLGTKLSTWRTWDDIRSSLFPRAIETQKESRASAIESIKPTLLLLPENYSAGATTSLSSTPNVARTPSRDENIGLSSSAVAVRGERPKLPANIQVTITSDNIVEVRVHIDSSGQVTSATAVTTRGQVATSLADYALDAARRWRFRPARDSGQPVESDKVLEFLFRPSDFSPAQ
jgi:TonB family protein